MQLLLGDCLEVLRTLPDGCVDSVVTDPPYGLTGGEASTRGFMGKAWDGSGIEYNTAMWQEVLRVLKPGGHLLAFAGTRTYHRIATAIEDAGFEVRDMVQWIYGSGFPKSHNISKAIDREAGAVREVVGTKKVDVGMQGGNMHAGREVDVVDMPVTAPATKEAVQWDGWGTALKPANEPICLARRPISEDTIAQNVLKYGTGGLNIEAGRIEATDGYADQWDKPVTTNISIGSYVNGDKLHKVDLSGYKPSGRWPANVIFDEDAAAVLDEQTGVTKGRASGYDWDPSGNDNPANILTNIKSGVHYGDKGGASRFFYVAKSSTSERNAGLDDLDKKPAGGMKGRNDGTFGKQVLAKNIHPTVKPITLMRYLIKLITPPGGVVLDPFMGSGSTGCAAVLDGFDFVGIEKEAEYMDIARRRIAYWTGQVQQRLF